MGMAVSLAALHGMQLIPPDPLLIQEQARTALLGIKAAQSFFEMREEISRAIHPLGGIDLSRIMGVTQIAARLAAQEQERIAALRAGLQPLHTQWAEQFSQQWSLAKCHGGIPRLSADSPAASNDIRDFGLQRSEDDGEETNVAETPFRSFPTPPAAQLRIVTHPPEIETLRIPAREEEQPTNQETSHKIRLIEDIVAFLNQGQASDFVTTTRAVAAWAQLRRNCPETRADLELNQLIGTHFHRRLSGDCIQSSGETEPLQLQEGEKNVQMLCGLFGCDPSLVKKRAREAAERGPLPQRMPKPFEEYAVTHRPSSPKGGRGQGWKFQKIARQQGQEQISA